MKYKESHFAIHKLEEALDKLQDHKVLLRYTKEYRRGKRQKILDVAYSLLPYPKFVGQIKADSKRLGDDRVKLRLIDQATAR